MQRLPEVLTRFFARYPPQLYSAKFTGISYPVTKSISGAPDHVTASPEEASGSDISSSPAVYSDNVSSPEMSTTETETTPPAFPMRSTKEFPNPFLPYKNPATGRWHVRIGLRRQANLVKLAKQHGLEPLLPPGPKSTEYKQQRALQKGLRVKGTGEGQTAKGHIWERTMSATLEKRRKAMEEMPEMIRLWKQRGHGRGWKKYPK